ncbi:TPA: hypothetical protein SH437_004678 [Salmonella enterica]|nr:hypothetical protein [Salmonella enterica]HAC8267634.1 hypothetical protein [Salmonella enterica]HEH8877183.1 hypothetical protein [Salmonella enterica]
MRLTRLKTFIRNQFIEMLKDIKEDRESQKWVDLLTLKLLYGIIFTVVIERTYVWLAGTTLSTMMTPQPLIRSEQFTLSLLIHYPQYFLLGILTGLLALLILNLLMCLFYSLASYLYCRMTRHKCTVPMDKLEVPHD